MTDDYIELDSDVTDENSWVVLTEQWKNGPKSERTEKELREGLTLESQTPNDPLARRRIPWDYLVLVSSAQALRCRLLTFMPRARAARCLAPFSWMLARRR